MLDHLEARFRVIAQLQSIREKHTPGSRRYEQIEYAIDLALEHRRTVNDFLLRNVLRDARRILDRQAQQREMVPLPVESASDEGTTLSGWALDLFKDNNTPAAEYEVRQAAELLLQIISRSSRHASEVLSDLIKGATLADTAKVTGLTVHRINQIRHHIRNTAVVIWGDHHGN